MIPANSALRLKAVLDFDDENGVKRTAGDEWLFEGPGTYIPRKEVSIEEQVRATVIKPNQAIKLRARKECTDRSGNNRVTGEEWIVKQTGAYLPGAYEEVVSVEIALLLGSVDAVVGSKYAHGVFCKIFVKLQIFSLDSIKFAPVLIRF